nr:hypothetical protein [Tanacetum cinerariifolium]
MFFIEFFSSINSKANSINIQSINTQYNPTLLNVEAGIKVVATLPFVTSSVSATPKREDDNPTDSVTGANLRAIGPAERFVISLDSSHHSSTHAFEAEVASVIRSVVPFLVITDAVITTAIVGIPSAPILETSTKVNTLLHAFMFHDSKSMMMMKLYVAGPSHLLVKVLSFGSREVDSEHLHEVFISCWNISNDALLDDLDISGEFVNHLAPLLLYSQIRDMDYEQLFIEFNVGTARQAYLNVEVRMRTKYYLDERKRLELECVNQANLLKAKNDEVDRLKAQLLLKEAEAMETICLRFQVSTVEATEKIHADEIETLKQRNVALETKKNSLDGKVRELQSSVSTKDLELKDLNATLSSLRSQNNGLVDQVHVLEATCFGLREWLFGYENLTDRLEEFQDAQLKVVNDKVAKLDAVLAKMACHLEEKFYSHLLTTIFSQRWLLAYGLKLDGLAAGIDHGREGRSLTDVAAYNPSTKVDFDSALQGLCEIDFPLLAELKSHKDASVEDIMNLLRLEGPLADAPGMGDLQADIEQLKVLIHRSEDQVVFRETYLSFALSVSHSGVVQTRANIAAEWKVLRGMFRGILQRLKVVNDKVAKLDADLADMACHLEEKFYPHLLTTIFCRRWLLAYGLKLVLIKRLNSSEYLIALGAAISRAISKGMQDGVAAGKDHGRERRSLTDVATYNPSTEADFDSALQELCEIDFPLLAELKSHKDASVEYIMNLLCLEGPLADALSMGDLQPDIEANITAERSALLDVWTLLSEPLSVQNLIGESSNFSSVPAATVTTMNLSTTFASASSIPPITVDDYKIIHVNGQESSQGNVQGDPAIVEIEKEDLDTTPEHDLLS